VGPYWLLATAVTALALYRFVTSGEWLGWAFAVATVGLAIAHQGESIEVTGPILRHRFAWQPRDVDLRDVTDVWMTPRYRSLFRKLMVFDGRRATCLGPVERWAPQDWTAMSNELQRWLDGRSGCSVSEDAGSALHWAASDPS
jgi:hypothetical protein